MRLVLFLLFLVVPILEIWVLIQAGQVIGGWPTVALLLADSLLGAWIVRREGRRAWRGLQEALRDGRMPERELADGAMVVTGGMLLLTPGFLTDVAGLMCLLPLTRPLVRRLGAWFFARRVRSTLARSAAGPGLGSPFGPGSPFGAGSPFGTGSAGSPFGGTGGQGGPGGSGPVIHGEVIRDEPGPGPVHDSRRGLTGG
ncbi:FxsA family protein [Streptosporangium sandarakinum]|uniref:FxsA family protein n=1 Tax=Streptosporangium sandarakinum TaxID=1260955 RepID=UPI00342DEA7D